MIIAQISDTHIDPDHENGAVRLRQLQWCIDAINRLDPLPDAVIHTGDLAHNGSPEKYRIAAEALAGLKSPFFPVAGNRDDRGLLREGFRTGRDLMPGTGFLQYAVEDFPVRLLVLDTISATGNQGDYCQGRADNLSRTLAEAPDKPTVLFMHHPPFVVEASKYPHQFDPWDGVGRMAAALEAQIQVVGAFCGHAHREASGNVAHVPVSSMPSLATDLRLGDFEAGQESVPLYRLHRFGNKGGCVSDTRAAYPAGQDAAD